MRLMGEKTEFKNSSIIYFFFFAIIVLLGWLYWAGVLADEKWPAIISGLLTGLIVAVVQLFLSWREFQKMDKYDELKIKDILPRRNNRDYYREMISKAEKEIRVQGVTAQRFLHHFANREDSEEGGTVLLAVIGKGVLVRILVANPEKLSNADDKKKAEMADIRLKALSEEFNGRFKYAYYDHEPTHSIVTIDDESIVGPIFPGVPSEHTPAIHLENSSKYVREYLEYFEKEWKRWSKSKEPVKN